MALTYTPKQLTAGVALTASAVTEYTVPAATTTILKEIELCNTDTVVRTASVHVIASGGTLGVLNTLLNATSLQPNETKIISLSRVMPTGTFIQALASSAAVVAFNASGIEVT
jgi:hypothetical protein